MAMKAGADLWHMSNPSGPDLNFYDPESKAYFGYTLASSLGNRTAIYVGPDGTRFIDEATMTKHGKMHTHGTYQTAVSAWPAYAVFDEAALSAGPICSTFPQARRQQRRSKRAGSRGPTRCRNLPR